MNIWIPRPGDALRLLKPWTAEILLERRNARALMKMLSLNSELEAYEVCGKKKDQLTTFEFNAGDVLVVDRIYVRQGKPDFDSITLIVKSFNPRPFHHPQITGARFWVKLRDANKIDAELADRDNAVGGFAPAQYAAAHRPLSQAAVTKRGLTNAIVACRDAALSGDAVLKNHCAKMAKQISAEINAQIAAFNKTLPAALKYKRVIDPQFVQDRLYDAVMADGHTRVCRWNLVKRVKHEDGSMTRTFAAFFSEALDRNNVARCLSDQRLAVTTSSAGDIMSVVCV